MLDLERKEAKKVQPQNVVLSAKRHPVWPPFGSSNKKTVEFAYAQDPA